MMGERKSGNFIEALKRPESFLRSQKEAKEKRRSLWDSGNI